MTPVASGLKIKQMHNNYLLKLQQFLHLIFSYFVHVNTKYFSIYEHVPELGYKIKRKEVCQNRAY